MKEKKGHSGFAHLLVITLCFFIVGAVSSGSLTHAGKSTVKTNVNKEKADGIVRKMVEAHGGMKSWLDAPAFSFSHISHLLMLPVEKGRTYGDNWRYERVTVEPRSSRGYVIMPRENSSRIAVSNGTLWSQGYDRNAEYQSSPLVVMYYQYSFINLPWLTQLPGVNFEYTGNGKLPLDSKSYHMVKMTFNPESGSENKGYYILYIDPDSFILKGTRHTAIFPILPGAAMDLDVPVFPDSYYRVFSKHVSRSGLLIPTSYESYSGDGMELLSIHLILDPSFERPLDETIFEDLESTMAQY